MSKRSGSQKRKAKAKRLGVSLYQVEKTKGMSAPDKRRRRAEKQSTTIAAIRRLTEFVWTTENRTAKIREGALFELTDRYLKGIGGNNEWNKKLFGRLWGARFDNRNDYRTLIGTEIYQDRFDETQWSVDARAHPLLGEFEEAFSQKIRSRSTYISDDFKQILVNWNKVKVVKESDLITKAFLLVSSDIPFAYRWNIDDLTNVIVSLDRDKGAGYPWMAKKLEVISAQERIDLGIDSLEKKYAQNVELLPIYEANRTKVLQELPSVVIKVNERLRQLKDGVMPDIVNLTGLRTESSKYTDESKSPWKQRLVWNVPYDHAILEKLFCGKLQLAIKEQHGEGFGDHYWPSLAGNDYGEERILKLTEKAEEWGVDCISIDFEQFDQHITYPIMKQVMRIFGKHSQLDQTEKRYLFYGLLYSELWTGWGVLKRFNGIPSGSFFTNLADSIINAAFCEAVGLMYNTEVDYVINGDDCCLITRESVSDVQLQRVANHFGMEMEREKQWRKRFAFSFNKEVFSRTLSGSAPMLHRVLNSIMRHDQRKRILMDLEEMGAVYSQLRRIRNHPQRELFLRWLLNRLRQGGDVRRLNPTEYLGMNFPGVERYNAPEQEKQEHAITTYADDWFWNIICED